MILLAVGANLPGLSGGSPIETCRAAVSEIAQLPGIDFISVSSWYRSAAVPRSDQPDYVNGVVRLEGRADPAELLARLHVIEHCHGRLRDRRNAARTLDLDIIDIDGMVRDSPDPVLPHPRARVRAFVLLPLQEVAPGWIEPRTGQIVTELLADLGNGCRSGDGPIDWPVQYR